MVAVFLKRTVRVRVGDEESRAYPGDPEEVLGGSRYLEVSPRGQRDRMEDGWVSGCCCHSQGAWIQLFRVPRRWDPALGDPAGSNPSTDCHPRLLLPQ